MNELKSYHTFRSNSEVQNRTQKIEKKKMKQVFLLKSAQRVSYSASASLCRRFNNTHHFRVHPFSVAVGSDEMPIESIIDGKVRKEKDELPLSEFAGKFNNDSTSRLKSKIKPGFLLTEQELYTPLNLCETDENLTKLRKLWDPLNDENIYHNPGYPLKLTDSWVPSNELRQVIYSLHRLLINTDKRLDLFANGLHEHALKSLEWKLDHIIHLNDIGYRRLDSSVRKSSNRLNKRVLNPMSKLMNKVEYLEDSIIHDNCHLQSIFEMNNDSLLLMNNNEDELEQKNDHMIDTLEEWPLKWQSDGMYELNNVEWVIQLRKIQFNQPYFHWKLGLFIGPKNVSSLMCLNKLNATIDVDINVDSRYLCRNDESDDNNNDDDSQLVSRVVMKMADEKDDDNASDDGSHEISHEIVHHWQNMTESDKIRVDASFIKKDSGKLMSWGKFVPVLQKVIDSQTGRLPTDVCNANISVRMRVLNQEIGYLN